MSEKIWSDDAWEDYLYWQTQDKKTLNIAPFWAHLLFTSNVINLTSKNSVVGCLQLDFLST